MSEQAERAYRDSWSRLLAFATRHLEHVYDAEDVVQETFLAWLETGKKLDEETHMAWLFRVTENEIRDAQRYQVRWKRIAAFSLDDPDSPLSELAGPDSVATVLLWTEIEEALSALPVEHQWCVALAAQGWKGKEIAVALGLPHGTVNRYLHDVRKSTSGRKVLWGRRATA